MVSEAIAQSIHDLLSASIAGRGVPDTAQPWRRRSISDEPVVDVSAEGARLYVGLEVGGERGPVSLGPSSGRVQRDQLLLAPLASGTSFRPPRRDLSCRGRARGRTRRRAPWSA